tara:strand:- start:317 stop:427 length:111 start_codon:yes stop_codon:yes gene_type:complete
VLINAQEYNVYNIGKIPIPVIDFLDVKVMDVLRKPN